MPNWTDENGVSHFGCEVPGCCKPWGYKSKPEKPQKRRRHKQEQELMNKIEWYSNWCWIDQLDDGDLKHGELLFVRFPDGHAQGLECIIETQNIRVGEQGGHYDAPSQRAFAEIDYHGVKAKVPLVGLEARRV